MIPVPKKVLKAISFLFFFIKTKAIKQIDVTRTYSNKQHESGELAINMGGMKFSKEGRINGEKRTKVRR